MIRGEAGERVTEARGTPAGYVTEAQAVVALAAADLRYETARTEYLAACAAKREAKAVLGSTRTTTARARSAALEREEARQLDARVRAAITSHADGGSITYGDVAAAVGCTEAEVDASLRRLGVSPPPHASAGSPGTT